MQDPSLESLLAIDSLNPYRNQIEHLCSVGGGLSSVQPIDTRVSGGTKQNGLGTSYSCELVAPGQGWREASLRKQDLGVLWSRFCGTDLPHALFLSGALGRFLSTVKAASK